MSIRTHVALALLLVGALGMPLVAAEEGQCVRVQAVRMADGRAGPVVEAGPSFIVVGVDSSDSRYAVVVTPSACIPGETGTTYLLRDPATYVYVAPLS